MARYPMSVSVGGKRFYGWQSIEITRSMDSIAGSFVVSHKGLDPSNMPMGAECIIYGADERLLTGYIEEIESDVTDNSLTWQLKGRDKTGDLVDCNYLTSTGDPNYPNEFTNVPLSTIVEKLCYRFGIYTGYAGPVNDVIDKQINFTVNEGDTVAETISRICRLHALLPLTYGNGHLILTRTDEQLRGDNLQIGRNVQSAHLRLSNLERFQFYIVKATQKTREDFNLEQSFQMADVKEDSTIQRHRPLIMLDSAIGEAQQVEDKAAWERSVRAGKSRKYSCTVDGWFQRSGRPWRINTLVKVKDIPRGLNNETMLIERTKFIVTPTDGQKTYLDLVDPTAYQQYRQSEKAGPQNKMFDIKLTGKYQSEG